MTIAVSALTVRELLFVHLSLGRVVVWYFHIMVCVIKCFHHFFDLTWPDTNRESGRNTNGLVLGAQPGGQPATAVF